MVKAHLLQNLAVPMLFALTACGGSFRRPVGTETLAQLRVVTLDSEAQGNGAESECIFKRDVNACAWVSAYWKADYADAIQNCTTGDLKRCKDAVSYAGACEIRGLISGHDGGDYPELNQEGGGPVNGCYSHGFPPDLVTPPSPISIDKAIEYLAIGCKRGDHRSCLAGMNALDNGMMLGLEVGQDFETAKAFCLVAMPTALEGNPDGCDLHGRMKETAEDRAARFDRVTAVYAAHQQAWAALAGKIKQDRAESEGATLRAIGKGLSEGTATNTAVTASLTTAQQKINTTVAASDAKNKKLPAASGPTAAPKPAPAPAQTAAAAKQKNLDDCLARPITQLRTTQTNPFIANRQGFESLLAAVHRCKSQPWKTCMFAPHMGALWAIEPRADSDHTDLFRRFNAPGIHGVSDVCLDQPVRGTRGDCETDVTTNRDVCIARLTQDIDQMNCDFGMLPKVWAAETTKRDADAKTKQDEACHRQFD
ncbi:MAG: hypothetical protein JWO36_6031 [Myxococcales bacterium]|nr:hypothetical protein [Myxococcales bacterium]